MINVEFKHEQLSAKLKDLSKRQIKTIVERSIRRALSAGQTDMKKELKQDYQIPAAALKDIKAATKDMTGRLYISGRPRSYAPGRTNDRWKATQLRKGVKIYVKRGAPKLLPGTFIATMPTGHTGIFERLDQKIKRVKKKNAAGRTYYSQLPIREIKGPSLPQLFAAKARTERVKTVMVNKYMERLRHEINKSL